MPRRGLLYTYRIGGDCKGQGRVAVAGMAKGRRGGGEGFKRDGTEVACHPPARPGGGEAAGAAGCLKGPSTHTRLAPLLLGLLAPSRAWRRPTKCVKSNRTLLKCVKSNRTLLPSPPTRPHTALVVARGAPVPRPGTTRHPHHVAPCTMHPHQKPRRPPAGSLPTHRDPPIHQQPTHTHSVRPSSPYLHPPPL
jgi:hypothetical protein